MKRYKSKFVIVLFAIGFLISCKDDYLVENNPNEIAADNFWRDLKDTNAGLTATYSTLLNRFLLNIREEAWRSDMGWPGWGRPTFGSAEGVPWYYKTFNNGDQYIQRKWEACYQGIFRANQVIEGLEKIKGTVNEDEWKVQMGQARFLRGLFHYYLYSSFNNGSVIIRDAVPKSVEDFNKSLSPATDVVAFLRADLEYAYENLPAQYEDKAINKGRPAAGAAATILGASYLNEKDYPKASEYFDDVIKNPAYGYELVQDLSLMFTIKGEFNKESIFEIAYDVLNRTELGQWDEQSLTSRLAAETAGSGGCLTPSWLAYAYKTEPLDPKDNRNWYNNPNSSTGRSLRNVPLRASAMCAIVEDEQTPYYVTGSVTDNLITAWNGWGFARPKQYTNHDYLEKESDLPKGGWNSGKNVTVNRLADVYLMQAECFIQTGNLTGALELINAVRARWGIVLYGPAVSTTRTFDNVTYTKETLMDKLMFVDKPLELSIEGHSTRWTDLRRWGIIGEVFQKHASEVFYAVDYNYVKADGTARVVQFSSLVLNPGSQPNKVIDYEYDDAAANYNPALHDYLPIPLSEVMSNPNIN